MARREEKRAVGRREFLKGVAAGAGTLAGAGALAAKAAAPAPARAFPLPAVEGDPPPSSVEVLTVDRPGSDFMVDVLKSLDFEYSAPIPAPASAACTNR